MNLPVLLTLSNVDLAILVYASPGQDESLQSLAQPTAFPGAELRRENASFDQVIRADRSADDSRLLLAWLRNTMEVFQSAASSPDFLAKAAEAVSEIVGLDHAAVLSWRDGQWHVDAACHAGAGESRSGMGPESFACSNACAQQKRTFWKTPLGESQHPRPGQPDEPGGLCRLADSQSRRGSHRHVVRRTASQRIVPVRGADHRTGGHAGGSAVLQRGGRARLACSRNRSRWKHAFCSNSSSRPSCLASSKRIPHCCREETPTSRCCSATSAGSVAFRNAWEPP